MRTFTYRGPWSGAPTSAGGCVRRWATRGIEPGSLPFWVGGYAIDEPSLRDAIAAKVVDLCDPKPGSV